MGKIVYNLCIRFAYLSGGPAGAVLRKGEAMTRKWLVVLGVVLLTAQAGVMAGAEEAPMLKTEKDKVNYGIGVSMGRNLKRQGIEVDVDLVVKGMKDELSGGKLLMSQEELQKTMREFQTELMQKQVKAKKTAAQDNKKEGDAFLAKKKQEKGVVTTKSGLQYKILAKGTGKKPTENDTVEVNYKGTLIDGKVFDSSNPGQPITLQLKQVIRGWQEALKLMPVGSRWQLFIPPELAYGEQGAGAEIGPNATLIFEVELVAIK
jgi:FKBP-type peptidyl-prolyl cis-trans isomerase